MKGLWPRKAVEIPGVSSYTKMGVLMIIEEAKKALETGIGLSLSQIRELDLDDEIAFVKKKTGRDLEFPKAPDPRKRARGNPLLAKNKITTREEIDARIDSLV